MQNLIGKSIMANLFRGFEAVGGKISFTNDDMIFKAHMFNVQSETTIIPYDQIIDVMKRSTYGIIPNGISVIIKDGTTYNFVLYNRNRVIEFLKHI